MLANSQMRKMSLILQMLHQSLIIKLRKPKRNHRKTKAKLRISSILNFKSHKYLDFMTLRMTSNLKATFFASVG